MADADAGAGAAGAVGAFEGAAALFGRLTTWLADPAGVVSAFVSVTATCFLSVTVTVFVGTGAGAGGAGGAVGADGAGVGAGAGLGVGEAAGADAGAAETDAILSGRRLVAVIRSVSSVIFLVSSSIFASFCS